ncbi:hypothetical protein [Microbulbifer thermotolerans]|uniref:Transposase IS200-like domain-containing protein n=1 Tax=Microbulbifer thermotolerans TaxID=252514 RepID=A0A143HPN3_MICTH|nr:hypothetical protein [Microbulbifer thermotolerans]AMX03456.1 hypothetical protein A3224_13510 [Microbulbifer thermotolerans]
MELAGVFALDICAFAVMSNHYHVVLHINAAQAKGWTLREVVDRWHQLCKGSPLAQRYAHNETLNAAELARLEEVVTEWRARLIFIWTLPYNGGFRQLRMANSHISSFPSLVAHENLCQ